MTKGDRSSENNGRYYGQKSQNSFRNGSRDIFYIKKVKIQRGKNDNKEK